MVLEETLMMYDRDDAQVVADALRKKGIPVRIVRKEVLIRSILVVGRIRDLKAAIEEDIARFGDDEEARSWLKRSLAALERSEEDIAAFLQQYPPGEAISLPPPKRDLPGFCQTLREGGADEEEVRGEVGKILTAHSILDLLEQNEQLERTGGGATLRAHPDPADLVTTLPREVFEETEPETLAKHAIMTSMRIISEPDYYLEFSPEAIARLKIADIDDLLEEVEIDPDSYDAFQDTIYSKRAIVSRVMDALEGRGTVSTEEIFAILQSDVFTISGGIREVALDLDLEFVRGLLNDMRKIGMIRRKGAGYRAA